MVSTRGICYVITLVVMTSSTVYGDMCGYTSAKLCEDVTRCQSSCYIQPTSNTFCCDKPGIVSTECQNQPTTQAQLECLTKMVSDLKSGLLPRAPWAFKDWAGNDVPVYSRLGLAFILTGLEVVVLLCIVRWATKFFAEPTPAPPHYTQLDTLPHGQGSEDIENGGVEASTSTSAAPIRPRRISVGPISCGLDLIGDVVGAVGWLFWLTYFLVYWNFISYLLGTGILLVLPGIVATYRNSAEHALLPRRLRLGGWMLGLVVFAMLPNVTLLPQQVYRHIYNSETTLTPEDPLVLELRQAFYDDVTLPVWEQMNFKERMYAVDDFVIRKIIWKSDYSQYGMVGLLTSPHDVITRMAGDCQGQAVTTASLLMSLGYHAAVCESPFHWWTHAFDNVTGEEHTLNQHGMAGEEGTVTPQPIDMVYTRWPPACKLGTPNCDEITDVYNKETTLYAASPWRGWSIAMVGMHEFRRDVAPSFSGGNQWKLVVAGAVLALVAALYSSYFHADLSLSEAALERLVKRAVVAALWAIPTMLGMWVWAYVFYPNCMVHLFGNIAMFMAYISSDAFNKAIGTPDALQTELALARAKKSS